MKTAQYGISAVSMALLLLIGGFLLLLGLRLMPIYLEHWKVVSSLESLSNEPELAAKTGPEILDLLMKRLDVNDVDNVSKENVEIKRADTSVSVRVKYEVRKELIGNIDAVAKFDDSIRAVAR